jgi:hypothetical protein
MTTRSDAINVALERFTDFNFNYLDAPGFASHGPMGAETLSTLGHDDLVPGWVDQYVKRNEPLPAPPASQRIDLTDPAATAAALGDPSRVSDWAVAFRHRLAEQPWQAMVSEWIPKLMPGYAGALTHGLIRTSHAIRAFPADESPSGLMLDELAHGLALWAATFKVLPGHPQLSGPLTLADATRRLPRPEQPWPMTEAGTFSRIGELDGFPSAVEALGKPDSAETALSALSAQFCQVMLAYPDMIAIPLVHTVTPIAASRTLLPYLPELSTEQLFAQLWQVGAAITVAFTPSDGRPDEPEVEPIRPAELLARAAEHRDTHVLKFSEACTREYALNPDPVYLSAASHVVSQLPAW